MGCGAQQSGQLGDGTVINRSTPVQVMSGVSAVAAGDYHTLFLKDDGSAWGCGLNTRGQLGLASISRYFNATMTGSQSRLPQTIDFPAITDRALAEASPVPLSATSSSGLPIRYEIVEGSATLTAGTLTLLGAGKVTIRANQDGDFTYAKAPAVERSFNVIASAFAAFLAEANVPDGQRDVTSDPDHDSIPNLMEYALDLHPMQANHTGLPVVHASDTFLTLTYHPVRPDVIYLVQTNDNLSDSDAWTSTGINQGSPDASGFVSASAPMLGTRRFLRLKVTLSD
jgi:hypothetical protein